MSGRRTTRIRLCLAQVGDASASQSPLSFGGFGGMVRHLPRLARVRLARTAAPHSSVARNMWEHARVLRKTTEYHLITRTLQPWKQMCSDEFNKRTKLVNCLDRMQ